MSSPSAPASLAAAPSASAECTPATASSDVPLAGWQLGVLHFVDKSYGWITSGVGPDLRILRTLDGGATWSSSVPLAMSYAIDLRFADHCSGWLLGVADGGARVVLYGTADGGVTWQEDELTRGTDQSARQKSDLVEQRTRNPSGEARPHVLNDEATQERLNWLSGETVQ